LRIASPSSAPRLESRAKRYRGRARSYRRPPRLRRREPGPPPSSSRCSYRRTTGMMVPLGALSRRGPRLAAGGPRRRPPGRHRSCERKPMPPASAQRSSLWGANPRGAPSATSAFPMAAGSGRSRPRSVKVNVKMSSQNPLHLIPEMFAKFAKFAKFAVFPHPGTLLAAACYQTQIMPSSSAKGEHHAHL
jgi:hypothetical protein